MTQAVFTTNSPTSGAWLRVDHDAEIPVGTQLAWKLRGRILRDRLGPGERLPSVRELAEAAGVNVNTVRAVYRRLEEEGYIVSRHGRGTFVAERAPSGADFDGIAAEVLADARAAGLDPRELAAAIYASSELEDLAGAELKPAVPSPTDLPSRVSSTLPEPDRQVDELVARRELRRQVAKLEAELAGYAEELDRTGSTTHPLLRPKGHVADVAELERTRDRLLEQLAEARVSSDRRAGREQTARAQREAMVRAPAEHKWQWVSNEEAGEPGCKNWHVRPRYGVLGMVMGWWRVKVSSGCPLAGAA